MDCQLIVEAVLAIRGTNPCENSVLSLSRAVDFAECCCLSERFDLAGELLDIVESFPLGSTGHIAKRARHQRERITNRNSMKIPQSTEENTVPPLIIRGLNFANAMFRWTSSGMPRRTQAEIDERLAICQTCPHFVDNHCRVCGCPCVETNQLINKLALATEACPLGKWK